MAGVAMENRLFRIVPNARDTPFIDACAAFLTPKMELSQVMPSGCNLRRAAIQPRNQIALPERPSASTFEEEQQVVDPATMEIELATPVFQPYRGETGRKWMEKEYGITADTSSLLSSTSGTERYDTDKEVCSFDLGPEPYKHEVQGRLSSDEWMDDYQQGLVPGGSEPRNVDYDKYLAMPRKPSILDTMRQECEENDEVPPTSPERARTPTIRFEYDYATDAPPDIQRMVDAPMHSTPHPDPPTLSSRSGPTLLPPRPRSSSVPPTSKTIKRMAIRYMPVTETVTPPISPARALADDPQTGPDTPSPTQKPGRSRGHGKWRAPQTANPGVGTRSKTKQLQTEMDQTEATQAQASRAAWPPRNDDTKQLQRMTRELQIVDRPKDVHSDMLRMLPVHKVDQNQNVVRPPVVGIQTQQQDIFFIPPPRAAGGALGNSTPVSTATLGLIHRSDPSLAAQLREDPASLASHTTRLRVYSTMRLIRTGMLGQLASLQQWEEAMRQQDEQ